MNTYEGSEKYEYVTSLRSSVTISNFSSARYTVSEAEPESRFLSFILTTDALRPDLLNSAFWTTRASLPTIITLPAFISCAISTSVPHLVVLNLYFNLSWQNCASTSDNSPISARFWAQTGAYFS